MPFDLMGTMTLAAAGKLPNPTQGGPTQVASLPASATSPATAPSAPVFDLQSVMAQAAAGKLAPPPAPPQSAPAAPGQPADAGNVANITSGITSTLYGAADGLVNLSNKAANLPIRGINSLFGTNIPKFATNIGQPDSVLPTPGQVVPVNETERVEQAAGGAVAALPLMALGGAGLEDGAAPLADAAAAVLPARVGAALQAAAPVAQGVGAAVKATPIARSLAPVVAGAATGQVAADNVPAPYAGLANVAGNLIGGGLVGAGQELAAGTINKLSRAVGGVGIGPKTTFTAPDGSTVKATGTQANTAAQTLYDAAGHGNGEHLRAALESDPLQATADRLQAQMPAAGAPDQEDVAGQLSAVRTAMAARGNQYERVPGEAPVTAQVSLLPGVQQMSRAMALAPENAPSFLEREQQQNAARLTSIQGQAPETASPAALGEHFVNMLQGLQDDAAAQTAGGEGAVRGALAPLPSQVSEDVSGETMRNAAVEAKTAQQQSDKQQFWDKVDPEGTLAHSIAPAKETANMLLGNKPVPSEADVAPEIAGLAQQARIFAARPDNGEQMHPLEANVLARIAAKPDVVPFQDTQQLMSSLGAAKRAVASDVAGGFGSGSRSMVRLRMMEGALYDSLSDGAADAVSKDVGLRSTLEQMDATPPVKTGAQGQTDIPSEAFTPSGRAVGVRYAVRDAGDLIASHDAEGEANPRFPQQLQPRDRSRSASAVQINKIASQLNPKMLGYSHSSSDGAPIIGPDGLIESGNGRVLGIRKAYDLNLDSAANYRNWLEEQGYKVSGMKHPVLVRERTTPLSAEDRVAFARESNMSPLGAMSKAEQAKADSQAITPSMLESLRASPPTSLENRPFVRSFIQAVAPHDIGTFLTRDGDLSIEGASRVRHALLAKAYPADHVLIDGLTENDDPDVRALGGGLLEGAPAMAKLQSAVKAGVVAPDKDLAPALKEALTIVSKARRASVKISDMVAQQDAFERPSDLSDAFLKTAYGDNYARRVGRERVGGILTRYAQTAVDRGLQPSFLGVTESPAELLKEASASYDRSGSAGRVSGSAAGRVSSSRTGGGATGSFGIPGGPGISADGASREGVNLEQGGGAGDDGSIVSGQPTPTLKPNATAADVAAFKAARRATAITKTTYNQGPVGDILKAGANGAQYRIATNAGVARKLFGGGSTAPETVAAYLKAVGGRTEGIHAARDFAVSEFHRAGAIRPDGLIDAKKYDALMAKPGWAGVIKQFPEVRAQIGTAAALQRSLDEASATSAKVIKNYQDGVAKTFLKKDAEGAVRDALTSKDSGRNLSAIIDAVQGNADATESLKAHVVDYMLGKFAPEHLSVGAQGEANDGHSFLKQANFAKFIGDNRAPLRRLFGGQGMQNFDMVRASIKNEMARMQAVKGSQTTPNKLNAMAHRVGHAAGHPSFLSFVGLTLGEHLAEHIGLPGIVGEGVGAVAGPLIARLRGAGMKTTNDLKAMMMLHPEFARTMLQRVPVGGKPSNVALARIGAAAQAALTASLVGHRPQQAQ